MTVVLKRVYPERGRDDNLMLSFQGSSLLGYCAYRIHIFDPKTKKIVISSISKITCVDRDIDNIIFGESENSLSFIKDKPKCDLVYSRKPKT